MKRPHLLVLSGLAAVVVTACVTTSTDERGFVSLFDGKTLDGWTLLGKKGDGYIVTNGVIACTKGGGGNLLTEKQYADFILRFEFRVEPGGNNGVGIRAPLTDKQIAYYGMELQILDDYHPKYAKLRPAQYHGSIYDVVPARRGAVRMAGGWNRQEVTAIGRRVTVRLNGKVIVDADLNEITDPAVLQKHPGLLRERGHIGFLGHNDYVEFRNIRIKELPDHYRIGSPLARNNVPPEGFTALFNGVNLAGWQGQMAKPNHNPVHRARLSPEERARAQAEADEHMRAHWSVQNGVLVFDGKGRNLVTSRDYTDFELLVDWRIYEGGDSGIYLRGTPRVQIWDPMARPENGVGSGGLFNNKVHPGTPLKRADRFIGEWNRFRILMQGEQVIVFLNDELVVYDEKKRTGVVMENYWEPDKPIYPSGPIELQNHGNTLYFKNIYIRELPAKEAAAR